MASQEESGAGDDSLWRTWLGRAAIRSAQLLLVLAVVALAGVVVAQLRLVVVPVLVALLLAAAVSPVVGWLAARGMPRQLAASLVLLGALTVLGGVGWLVGEAVAGQWGELRQGALDGLEELRQVLSRGPLGLPDLDTDTLTEQVTTLLQGPQLRSGALTGATALTQAVAGLFLAVVVLYYLLADTGQIRGFLREQLPASARERFDRAGARSVEVAGGYLRGTAVVAFVDALLIGIGLGIVGIPLVLPLAAVVFLGAFVPLIGAVAAGAIAVLVALVSNGLVTALVVLGIVVAVNQVEGNLLQPVVLSRTVSLHPLAVLLALSAGTIVAGIAGAVLAVPLTAVLWAVVQVLRGHDDVPADEPTVDGAAGDGAAGDATTGDATTGDATTGDGPAGGVAGDGPAGRAVGDGPRG